MDKGRGVSLWGELRRKAPWQQEPRAHAGDKTARYALPSQLTADKHHGRKATSPRPGPVQP